MMNAQQRIDTIRQAYREFESATGTLIECGCEPKSIKELVDIIAKHAAEDQKSAAEILRGTQIDRANTQCAGSAS